MQIEIRRAAATDVGSLAELHAAAVAAGYRHIFPKDSPAPTAAVLSDGWLDLLEDAGAEVVVAEVDGAVVGSVAIVADESVPSGLLLKRLHVVPDLWGNGLGAALHDEALAIAGRRSTPQLNLWVLEANTRARAMYERRGWTLCVPRRTFANQPAEIVDVLYERSLPTDSPPETA